MNPGLITRLINLVRKTGHRVVLGDPESGQAVVIMDLAEYEKMIGVATTVEVPSISESTNVQFVPRVVNTEPHRPQNNFVQALETRKTLEALMEAEAPVLPITPSIKRPETQPIRGGAANLTMTTDNVNVNREIGGQKANQGNRIQADHSAVRNPNRVPVNHSAVQPIVQPPTSESVTSFNQLEEEERFYLEPLE